MRINAVLCKLTRVGIVDYREYEAIDGYGRIFTDFSGIFETIKMAIYSKNEAVHFLFIFYPHFFVYFSQRHYTLPLESSEG